MFDMLEVPEKKPGDHQLKFILRVSLFIVQHVVPIHAVDVEIFQRRSEKSDWLLVLEERSGSH